jgi:hypothetical protein
LFSGRRRFCIRTCDQIRSTGSRSRNAATGRTERRSNSARIEASRPVDSSA